MTTDETPDPAPQGRRRRFLILGILGGIVVLLLVVAAVWAATSPTSQGPTPAPTSSSASRTPTPAPSSSASPSPSASTPPPTVAPGAAPDPSLDANDEVKAPLDEPQPVTQALTIKVSSVKAVEGTADEPGEIAGPSLQFVIDFVNSSGATISLRDVAINVDYGADQTPAIELREASTSPVPDEVAAGATVTGTYTFNVPEDERDLVRLLVFTTVDDPVIAFSGPAPR